MAGAKHGHFRELVSPFLKAKLAEAESQYGVDSGEYQALHRQYLYDPVESDVQAEDRRRHYESELHMSFEGRPVVGVERLYRRTVLIEPTTVCAAHCRWCLRGQYPVKTMSRDEITHAARFIGSEQLRDDVREVLITGGDPLMSQPLLRATLENLRAHAPNIGIVRIGSRVPFQDPERINEALLELFASFPEYRFEIGVNVNHPVEFWPEAEDAIRRLSQAQVRVYNQHPLLRGVNDDLDTLIALYSKLRDNDIEAHYLFHAIPLRGMNHHRTSLQRGLELATQLSSCGEFSGRSKPHYAVLSDIGKIVLYHGSIVSYREEDNAWLLRSGFTLEGRKRWNPSWNMPPDTIVDNDGILMTWYRDARDPSGLAEQYVAPQLRMSGAE